MHRRLAARLVTSLLFVALAAPAAVHAATAVTLTLGTSASSPMVDQAFTLTVTASQNLDGLWMTFVDDDYISGGPMDALFHDNVASITLGGVNNTYPNIAHHFHAEFAGGGGFAAASSNTVVVTVNRYPASMTYTFGNIWNDGTVNVDDSMTFKPRITAASCVGTFQIMEYVDGSPTPRGSQGATTSPGGVSGSCGANISIGYYAVGTYHFRIFYSGTINEDLETSQFDVPVTLIETHTSLVASPNPVEVGTPTHLTATVGTDKGIGFVEGEGTFTFHDGATVLGTASPTGASGSASIDVALAGTGTHTLSATWGGTAIAAASTSANVSLSVVTNVVHASGLGVTPTTFYPVADGYLDTLTIKGTLGERASVAITIIKVATGSTVRTLSVPLRDQGAYTVLWDGRTAGGTLLPAGTYQVKQVVKDELDATLTVTSSVSLSQKKLVWYSTSTTKLANAYAAKGKSGATIGASPLYSGGMRMTFPLGTPGRYAALGYQFWLHSGAASYRYIKVSVLGSGTHAASLGLHDFRLGNWASGSPWLVDFFSPFTSVTKSYQWTTRAGSATYNRKGTSVQAVLAGLDWSSGRYDLAKVKLSYQYALLQ